GEKDPVVDHRRSHLRAILKATHEERLVDKKRIHVLPHHIALARHLEYAPVATLADERICRLEAAAHSRARARSRAVSRLGLVGGVVPAYTRFGPRNLGERALDPVYAAAERLGVPIAIHASGGLSPLNERFGRFVQVHTFSHVPEQMAAVTATVLGGVFER